MGINILGMGRYLPEQTITNADFEKFVETDDEWIRTRTGISERRMAGWEPSWYMGSEAAKQAIEKSGINPEEIGMVICCTITSDFLTPSMASIIQHNVGAVNAAAFDLNAACSGFLMGLGVSNGLLPAMPGKYILLSAHREENIDIESNFMSLMNAVNELARTYDMPVLYSCHPRSEKMIAKRGFKFDERVIQHKPLGFFDYNKLQQNAFCVVSDSGTVPEEGAFFHFPAVSVRTSTERPEAMDKGVFTIGSITSEAVCQAVALATEMHANGDDPYPVPAYTDENVSTKVVKLIQSYTGIVDRMVWRKY